MAGGAAHPCRVPGRLDGQTRGRGGHGHDDQLTGLGVARIHAHDVHALGLGAEKLPPVDHVVVAFGPRGRRGRPFPGHDELGTRRGKHDPFRGDALEQRAGGATGAELIRSRPHLEEVHVDREGSRGAPPRQCLLRLGDLEQCRPESAQLLRH